MLADRGPVRGADAAGQCDARRPSGVGDGVARVGDRMRGGWATECQEVGDGVAPLIEQTKEQTIEQTPPFAPLKGGGGGR